MSFDELRRYPNRVSVRVIASSTVEGSTEMEFSPTVLVVSDEQDGLAHHRHDCFLVLLGQAIQQFWWKAREHDGLAGSRCFVKTAHIMTCCDITHMAKPVPLPPPGFDDLSVEAKIDYLESLWDRIAATPETIPVPEWHREIIDDRLKDLDANPNGGESWEVVKERLRKNLDYRD